MIAYVAMSTPEKARAAPADGHSSRDLAPFRDLGRRIGRRGRGALAAIAAASVATTRTFSRRPVGPGLPSVHSRLVGRGIAQRRVGEMDHWRRCLGLRL